MKLNGVFSAFFVLVTFAYAHKGKHDKKHKKHCESSSSSSSDIEVCKPEFAECFKTERMRHHKKKPDNCEIYRPEKEIYGPYEPQYAQHHKRHHHKSNSKHCRRLLCDVKCLVGESYMCISQSICTQFSELGVGAKHSMEKASDRVEKDVIADMNRLEKDVLDIVKEPLSAAIKRIENVIEETNKYLEIAINRELERFDERNRGYFRGLIGIAVDIILEIIKDIAGGKHPNMKENTKELQRGVSEALRLATAEELKKIQDIEAKFMKDATKDIQKAFNGSEALVKSLIEKIFEKESSHLICLIANRAKMVENNLRIVVISVEREIEKAISCVSSSKGRGSGVIQTKLTMLGNIGQCSGTGML